MKLFFTVLSLLLLFLVTFGLVIRNTSFHNSYNPLRNVPSSTLIEYKNDIHFYSIHYPSHLSPRVENDALVYFGPSIVISVTTDHFLKCTQNCPKVTKKKYEFPGAIGMYRMEGSTVNDHSGKKINFIQYAVKDTSPDGYILITYSGEKNNKDYDIFMSMIKTFNIDRAAFDQRQYEQWEKENVVAYCCSSQTKCSDGTQTTVFLMNHIDNKGRITKDSNCRELGKNILTVPTIFKDSTCTESVTFQEVCNK